MQLKGEITLYRLCLWKIAAHMKAMTWNGVYGNNDSKKNPFIIMPPHIIEDLINCILKLSDAGSLRFSGFHHLLTSGRVSNFKVNDVLFTSEEFVSILMSLSTACQNLCFITLRNILFTDLFFSLHKTKAALECLLSISPQLKSIECCIEFDLKALRNCEKLKILKLNFLPKTPLYNFLKEEDGNMCPNFTLTTLEIFKFGKYDIQYLEVALVLKYCPALKEINIDICRSLEYLHANEMHKGTLGATYNLQKCLLGNIFPPARCATLTAAQIATFTCPDLKVIDILVNDNNVICALSKFKNLKSLHVVWEPVEGGHFLHGIIPVLSEIGSNLKVLHLYNFHTVDFSALATNCPLLEELKLKCDSEYDNWVESSDFFRNLKSLCIDSEISCSEKSLLILLSNCSNLTKIRVQNAANLTNSTLAKILNKNPLSKVEDAFLKKCSLSEAGVENLIIHLSSLKYLYFTSSRITFDTAISIINAFNPNVISRCSAN